MHVVYWNPRQIAKIVKVTFFSLMQETVRLLAVELILFCAINDLLYK